MALCPSCKKQDLQPGEEKCPHCKNKTVGKWWKVIGTTALAVGVVAVGAVAKVMAAKNSDKS